MPTPQNVESVGRRQAYRNTIMLGCHEQTQKAPKLVSWLADESYVYLTSPNSLLKWQYYNSSSFRRPGGREQRDVARRAERRRLKHHLLQRARDLKQNDPEKYNMLISESSGATSWIACLLIRTILPVVIYYIIRTWMEPQEPEWTSFWEEVYSV